MISDNFDVSIPEWFLFLYFKYWYFHSLKRFWDCDFNFVNVLELHQSRDDKWYNKRVLIWRFALVLIEINKMNCELMLTYDTPTYMFNVYKNQPSRQTGSRNLMGPKTLTTIWGTYQGSTCPFGQVPIYFTCPKL